MKFVGIVYLNLEIVLEIHKVQLEEHGGMDGIRDHGGLDSAIAQPQSSFGGDDLYPTVFEKLRPMLFTLQSPKLSLTAISELP